VGELLTDYTKHLKEAACITPPSSLDNVDWLLACCPTPQATAIIDRLPLGRKRNLFQFLFWSGARHGEALALERRDLELPYITIRRTLTAASGVTQTPKTGSARRILLPQKAIDALEQQMSLNKHEQIFYTPARNGHMTAGAVPKRTWKRVLRDLGIPYVRPYVTRHSFVSWMLMAGESEWKVAQHVGHRNTQMIQKVYGHFIPKSEPKWSLDDPSVF
jgi:integrase